jgi:photosystem I subunit 3
MQRLFALALVLSLWFGFTAPEPAHAYNLTPCSESAAFAQRAKDSVNKGAARRFELYSKSNLLCGEDGLPHLIVDGNLAHIGEFTIPGLMFLFITGWIGWAGRSYIRAIKKTSNPEEQEIIINVPLAIQCMLAAALWPLLAVKELLSGELTEQDNKVPVAPR